MIVTLILFLIMAWMSHHLQRTQRNSCKAHDNQKALCFDMCVWSLTQCVGLFVALWTVACQASLPMGFSRQESWSGLPFPSPEDLQNPGIEPRSPACSIGGFFTIWATREVHIGYVNHFNVWVAHKLSKKKLLTIFPHVILYLKIMKIKTNCGRWWKVDTVE